MDLNAPLGTTPTPRPRFGVGLKVGAALGAAVVASAGIGAWLLTANPRGGEPYAVAMIDRPSPKPIVPNPAARMQSAPDPMPTGSVAPQPPALQPSASSVPTGADAATVENGVRVLRGMSPGGVPANEPPGGSVPRRDATGGGPLVIDVSKALDGSRGPDGVKGSKDGKDSSASKTIDVSNALGGTPAGGGHPAARPRVAIFVGGMGLGAAATRQAIDAMPAAVTLAFVPTGAGFADGGLVAAVDAARAKGHEILLQLPMESAPTPIGGSQGARALGPHSLAAGEAPAALKANLAWLMGRLKGYDGVTNLLGAAVTDTPATMTGVLRAVGERGLFYVDDGTSRRSLAVALAPGLGVPAGRADVVLDATADPAVVRANLDALVALARRRGTAIGMASGLPEHLATIADYANDLGRQGVELVPVRALAGAATDVTAAR